MGNPQVIILDEPTVGLDPIQIIEIRALIKELGKKHTVIFSSHILSEVQTICEQILIIAHGQLIAFDKPENLEKQLLAPNEIILTTEASKAETQDILAGISHITEINLIAQEGKLLTMELKTAHDNIYDISRAIFFAFAAKKKALLEMSLKKANLEDVFIELTESSGPTSNDETLKSRKLSPKGEPMANSQATQNGNIDQEAAVDMATQTEHAIGSTDAASQVSNKISKKEAGDE